MPDEAAAVCAAVVEARVFLGRLAGLHVGCRDDRDRIDLIGVMEAVKGAAAAVQARVTADFAASQTRAAADRAADKADDRPPLPMSLPMRLPLVLPVKGRRGSRGRAGGRRCWAGRSAVRSRWPAATPRTAAPPT